MLIKRCKIPSQPLNCDIRNTAGSSIIPPAGTRSRLQVRLFSHLISSNQTKPSQIKNPYYLPIRKTTTKIRLSTQSPANKTPAIPFYESKQKKKQNLASKNKTFKLLSNNLKKTLLINMTRSFVTRIFMTRIFTTRRISAPTQYLNHHLHHGKRGQI